MNLLVSMNLFGFRPNIFNKLQDYFEKFISDKGMNPDTEIHLPDAINELVRKKGIKIKVLKSKNNWFGVTYKEDKEHVKHKLQQLVVEGVYPPNLWVKGINT